MNNDIYNTDIKYIKGVGEKRAKLLNKLGVYDLYDIVHYYPRSYIDFSSHVAISDVSVGEVNCVLARICSSVTENHIRSNMIIFRFQITDGSGVIDVSVFNNRYIVDLLKSEKEFYFIGKISSEHYSLQMTPQIIEQAREDLYFSPVYNLTSGLTSRNISLIVKNAIEKYRASNPTDPLPDDIKQKYGLCHEQYALTSIHFPQSKKDIDVSRKRFIFEELFVLQCGMIRLRRINSSSPSFSADVSQVGSFIDSLPFELTESQKKAVNDCLKDISSGRSMNRLVQGDVGSGKTVVASAVMYCVVKSDRQCAFMAPTEILANQHYKTLNNLFGESVNIALLTGSTKAAEKRAVKESLLSGKIDIVVGTHAVITDDVRFASLGLAVIDEQHRFGVEQRSSLHSKGVNPHILVMSATPIPRTLSLIIYGELDVSVIDELPRGRKNVLTYFVDTSYKQRVFRFIKKHLSKGFQAYIVCPLVEENETTELTPAVRFFESVKNEDFSEYSVSLLHGKMKSKDKEAIMKDFSNGKIDLLVSTTVIEIGIDVPNAVIMLIVDSDRFGLSQLHQLRGRVGRGSDQSYCILMSDNNSVSVKQRMDFLCHSNNGFEIADEDLKIRGPGEFFGSKQSGLPNLKIASFVDDIETAKQASEAAKYIFSKDRELKYHKGIEESINRLFGKTGETSFN